MEVWDADLFAGLLVQANINSLCSTWCREQATEK